MYAGPGLEHRQSFSMPKMEIHSTTFVQHFASQSCQGEATVMSVGVPFGIAFHNDHGVQEIVGALQIFQTDISRCLDCSLEERARDYSLLGELDGFLYLRDVQHRVYKCTQVRARMLTMMVPEDGAASPL